MSALRVFMSFREVHGPYGGANAFLRTLRAGLERRGVEVTTRLGDPFDVALLNALTNGIDLDFVREVADRAPVVHRKVGYRGSGGPEMRREVDGVVWGDRLQLEFTPHLAHTIFQSEYSRGVFEAGGFEGPSTVIHNGVDETIFNRCAASGPLRRGSRPRDLWDGSEPVRMIVSTWSSAETKGFPEYREIDAALARRPDVSVSLVGRVPEATRFRRIRVHRPRRRRGVAAFLKRHHVLLQLARFETCSNALLEGLSCGLPAIYLDSGANRELAEEYGVEYRGDFFAALDEVKRRYHELAGRLESDPYRSEPVVDRYLEVLRSVAR